MTKISQAILADLRRQLEWCMWMLSSMIKARQSTQVTPRAMPTPIMTETTPKPLMSTLQDQLYKAAFDSRGEDASPKDYAPDDLGCAESLSEVIQKAFPDLRFPTLLSTRALYAHLTNSLAFQRIDEPKYGCIILNVTGTGNGSVSNGHTGIMGRNTSEDGSKWIMSNDSRNGMWSVNYTIHTWKRYFETKGGMATLYFRRI